MRYWNRKQSKLLSIFTHEQMHRWWNTKTYLLAKFISIYKGKLRSVREITVSINMKERNYYDNKIIIVEATIILRIIVINVYIDIHATTKMNIYIYINMYIYNITCTCLMKWCKLMFGNNSLVSVKSWFLHFSRDTLRDSMEIKKRRGSSALWDRTLALEQLGFHAGHYPRLSLGT